MTNEDFKIYQSKLKECDKKYFEHLDIQDEIAFNKELLVYLKSDDCNVDEFAGYLVDFYNEHGYIVVDEEIVIWIIYQNDKYDYGSPLISELNASRLVFAMYECEMEAGDWEHSCSYWCIMAGFFDCSADVDENCYSLLQGYENPYPDCTTPETKLMYSKFYLDQVLALVKEENPDYEEAFRILSHSDIRLAKIKSFAGAKNKKASEIHKELCRDTAVAMYYLYSKLGDAPSGKDELIKSKISTQLETLEVCSSDGDIIEIANPLYKKEVPSAPKKSRKNSMSRRRKGKTSFLAKVKSTLGKIFKSHSHRKSNGKNSNKSGNNSNASDLQQLITQYKSNESGSRRFWHIIAGIPVNCLISVIIGFIFYLFLKLFFSPGYLWWIVSSVIMFIILIMGTMPETNEHRNSRVKKYLDDTDIHLPSFIVLQGYCLSDNHENRWETEYLVYFNQTLQLNAFHNPLRGHWSAQHGAGFEYLDTVVTFNYDDNTAKIYVECHVVE